MYNNTRRARQVLALYEEIGPQARDDRPGFSAHSAVIALVTAETFETVPHCDRIVRPASGTCPDELCRP